MKDEEKRKACYAALDAAHVSDDEEEDEDDDPVGKNEEVEIDEKFAGWIAMYGGKKLEIKKSEADGIWPAKQLAIKHFKVPKSKQGLLAIKPAHEEVEVDEHKMGASDTTDMYALMVKGMKQGHHCECNFDSSYAINIDYYVAMGRTCTMRSAQKQLATHPRRVLR